MGYRINKLVSSNFMGMVRSVSLSFDTGYTYSCYSNNVDFVDIEDEMFPRRIKGTAEGLGIDGFGVF